MTMDGTMVFEKMIEALRWVAGEDDACPSELDRGVHTAMLAKVTGALRAAGHPVEEPEKWLRARLAEQFIEALNEQLGPEKMREVIERNRTNAPGICASHDFCDANMVMDDAFTGLFGFGAADVLNDEDWLSIWNDAWAIAKAAEFDTAKVP